MASCGRVALGLGGRVQMPPRPTIQPHCASCIPNHAHGEIPARMSSDASTPLMRQYNSVKQQVPNTLPMFRLGDFYELFFTEECIAPRRPPQPCVPPAGKRRRHRGGRRTPGPLVGGHHCRHVQPRDPRQGPRPARHGRVQPPRWRACLRIHRMRHGQCLRSRRLHRPATP